MSLSSPYGFADGMLGESHGPAFDDADYSCFVSLVHGGMAQDEFVELEDMAESDGEAAFPADGCDLTGVCDPAIKPGTEKPIGAEQREAKTLNVKGGGQLFDYGSSKESVLKDDSISQ